MMSLSLKIDYCKLKRNSYVSMPTSHKGQDITANRGIDNRVAFTDSEVNL